MVTVMGDPEEVRSALKLVLNMLEVSHGKYDRFLLAKDMGNPEMMETLVPALVWDEDTYELLMKCGVKGIRNGVACEVFCLISQVKTGKKGQSSVTVAGVDFNELIVDSDEKTKREIFTQTGLADLLEKE
jgi:hypothetical protein